MHLKFAMLQILARRPDGRASIAELWREWEAAAGSHEPADRLSEFEDVDVFQAGLVVSEDDSLHITDAGRSVLRALDALGKRPTESGHPDQTASLKVIDDLIGTKLRMNIFDLGLRVPGKILNLEPLEDGPHFEPEAIQTEANADVDDEANAGEILESRELNRPGAIDAPDFNLPNAPSFLNRNSGSRVQTSARLAGRRQTVPAALTSHFQRFSHILRGHLAEASSKIKTDGQPAGISGALLAGLSMLVILIGAGLFIEVNQIKSLKSEITALERQLAPLKKQAAADQQEKEYAAEQKNQIPIPSPTEKGKNPVDNRPMSTTLVLAPDEVRLIREYIKPAPFTDPAVPPISVGDPIPVATIPLPSPLTDKVPKLLGARFTIRNGAIIILKRDSHQADAVLAPN